MALRMATKMSKFVGTIITVGLMSRPYGFLVKKRPVFRQLANSP